MPEGDKSRYTNKQKRKAGHIEEGYEKRGMPEDEAERIAWATVNKQDGGGSKSGSGRKSNSTLKSKPRGAKKTITKKAGSKKGSSESSKSSKKK